MVSPVGAVVELLLMVMAYLEAEVVNIHLYVVACPEADDERPKHRRLLPREVYRIRPVSPVVDSLEVVY